MILLDTNVVSEGLRPSPASAVVAWLDAHFDICAISTVTALELSVGVQLLPSGKRRDRLQTAVSMAIGRFGTRVLPFDEGAVRMAASLFGLARAGGLPLHQMPLKLADLQIAGIAATNGCSLATRNIGDFRGLGLDLIDPWSAAVPSP